MLQCCGKLMFALEQNDDKRIQKFASEYFEKCNGSLHVINKDSARRLAELNRQLNDYMKVLEKSFPFMGSPMTKEELVCQHEE